MPYEPIKTRADRNAERVEAVKDAAADFGKGFVKAVGQAVDRLVPQGRDELANALFNGSAYWPGEQPPSMKPDANQQDVGAGVHGETQEIHSPQEASHSVDSYAMGNYSQSQPSHSDLYVSNTSEPSKPVQDSRDVNLSPQPAKPDHNRMYGSTTSYTDRLKQQQDRSGDDRDRGMSR